MGATTRMDGPQRSRLSIFSRPIGPAPTTRHFFPSSFRNKGKRLTSLKVFTAARGSVAGHRLKNCAGKLLPYLLVTGTGKVGAKVFPGAAGLQIAAQQPLQRIGHFG